MHAQQIGLLVVMALGGAAVIGSYIRGFSSHPGSAESLWGGVSGGLRYFNYAAMIGAAVGFFLFTFWLLFVVDPGNLEVFGRYGYWMFYVIILLILIPSALWMPFLFAYLDSSSGAWWFAVRLVLVLVGVGALALLAAILTVSPKETGAAYWLAVTGAALFCIQTAVLDMFIWPALFKGSR